jgi:hypothetical protein
MSPRMCVSMVAAAVLGVSACGTSTQGTGGGPDAGGDTGRLSSGDSGRLQGQEQQGGDGSSGGCTGLACQVHACSGGGSTTLSGVVLDPAGKNPLYDIAVFVPNATPQPFTAGASCAPCADIYTGSPITSALTDADGKFTLTGVPDGKDIPLVIQIGKWRRQMTIANVASCTDNPQPMGTLTLPSSHGPKDDIPMIAISTGGSDTLECLLSRIGLDASEYSAGGTVGASAGHVQIFQGGAGYTGQNGVVPNTSPPGPQSYEALWDTTADLMKYDILMLSCEGEETKDTNQAALNDYASAGGRVFASHYHYAWFNTGPFGGQNLATWTPGDNQIGPGGDGNVDGTIVTTLPNGQSFPKGVALNEWLTNVGALTAGELPIAQTKHNADVSAANTPSQTWILADSQSGAPGAALYFSFNTPTTAAPAAQCGRVVYSDLHVGAASGDTPSMPVPAECASGDLSPQEKALEFMLFDLSSCVTPNSQPPTAPPPVAK